MELLVNSEESDIKQMYLQIVMSPTKETNEMFVEHIAGNLTQLKSQGKLAEEVTAK